jgi:hypothetical protein
MGSIAYDLFRLGGPGPRASFELTRLGTWSSQSIHGIGNVSADLSGPAAIQIAARGANWAQLVTSNCRCDETLSTLLAKERRLTVMRGAAQNPNIGERSARIVAEWLTKSRDGEGIQSMLTNPAMPAVLVVDVLEALGASVPAPSWRPRDVLDVAAAADAARRCGAVWVAAQMAAKLNDTALDMTCGERAALVAALAARSDIVDVVSERSMTIPADLGVLIADQLADAVTASTERPKWSTDPGTFDAVAALVDDGALCRVVHTTRRYTDVLGDRLRATTNPRLAVAVVASLTAPSQLYDIVPTDVANILVDAVVDAMAEDRGSVQQSTLTTLLLHLDLDDSRLAALLRCGSAGITLGWLLGRFPKNPPNAAVTAALVASPGHSCADQQNTAAQEFSAATLATVNRRIEGPAVVATGARRHEPDPTVWAQIPGVLSSVSQHLTDARTATTRYLGAQLNELVGDDPSSWALAVELLEGESGLSVSDVLDTVSIAVGAAPVPTP